MSSTGGAAQYQGHALGQYEYHEDKGYYVQTSTEQSDEEFVAVYLYPNDDRIWYDATWYVGPTPGEQEGYLKNTRPGQTHLSFGWEYGDTTTNSFKDENHDLAIARSSSSRADPGLRVAFKCLNV